MTNNLVALAQFLGKSIHKDQRNEQTDYCFQQVAVFNRK